MEEQKVLEVVKNYNIKQLFQQGYYLDVNISENQWEVAKITEMNSDKITVEFDSLLSQSINTFSNEDKKLAPFRSHTCGYTGDKNNTIRKINEPLGINLQNICDKSLKIISLTEKELCGYQIVQVISGELFYFIDTIFCGQHYKFEQIVSLIEQINVVYVICIQLIAKLVNSKSSLIKNQKDNEFLYVNNELTAIFHIIPELLEIIRTTFLLNNRSKHKFANEDAEKLRELFIRSFTKSGGLSMLHLLLTTKNEDGTLFFNMTDFVIKLCFDFNLEREIFSDFNIELSEYIDKSINENLLEKERGLYIKNMLGKNKTKSLYEALDLESIFTLKNKYEFKIKGTEPDFSKLQKLCQGIVSTNPSEFYIKLMKNEKTMDAIAFLGKDKKPIKFHKAILSGRSKYFENMFFNEVKEIQSQSLVYDDLNENDFKILIEYCYTSCIPDLTIAQILKISEMADRFMIKELASKLASILYRNMDVGLFKNTMLSYTKYTPDSVRDAMQQFFKENQKAILGSGCGFFGFSKDEVKKALSKNRELVDETLILKNLVNYIKEYFSGDIEEIRTQAWELLMLIKIECLGKEGLQIAAASDLYPSSYLLIRALDEIHDKKENVFLSQIYN